VCLGVSFLREDDSCNHDAGTAFGERSDRVYCSLCPALFLPREGKGPLPRQLRPFFPVEDSFPTTPSSQHES